jgi:hypothetical protein
MKFNLLLLAAAMAVATPALAQAPAAAPAMAPRCAGELQVLRLSKLKPGTTMADFEKVVAQHMAWYRSHGYTANVQRIGQVMTPQGMASDQVYTAHINPPGVPRDKHDAGWDAFVAAYAAISEVSSTQLICFAKP